jgi:dTDP-4-amino-4,6-dideoxygalactose transaminase
VLSFGGSKLLTAGRGGALLTNQESIMQRAKIFAERGNNAFPLSELQAAVLGPQLSKLASRNRKRRELARLLVNLARQQVGNLVPVEHRKMTSPFFTNLPGVINRVLSRP